MCTSTRPEPAAALLRELAGALDLPEAAAAAVEFVGIQRLPSCFAVSDLAASAVAAACLAVAELVSEVATRPRVRVDMRLASLWFGFSLHPLGWKLPALRDALTGDYPTRDGWIKLHANAPHHRDAVLRLLGCPASREALSRAVASWPAEELEQAVVAAGGCAARLRERARWQRHAQGRAVAREPLVWRGVDGDGRIGDWLPLAERPLAGLRVLDLTRVLAGPVATRFLAGYGAQVLRIDAPDWDEPGAVPEVTAGKRCARLDLRQPRQREVFEALLAQADILVHGLRPGALDGLGLGAQQRRRIRPGLIDVSLDAYGHAGPWAARRGFDSLVQFSCGIAARGMAWRQAGAPVSLPVQALDHATGYLMAAAVVRALTQRLRAGQAWSARVSLARTAELLFAHPGEAADAPFVEAAQAELAQGIEATAWGPARRLHPPAVVAGAPMRWDTPAVALGSAQPQWQAQR